MSAETSDDFAIAEGYGQVAAYLEPLRNAADADRDALGFFARSVYEEFARDGSLYVLVRNASRQPQYAGHLLFSCRYPKAHVLQIYVLPEHRRSGRADFLLRHLKESLVRQGFISIGARVAEDLADANAFWERQHFYVQRVERGGATRNRNILVRSHELPSPQLFPPSGLSGANPLGLSVPASSDIPLFLVDLNVLFDSVQPRRLRHEEVAALFQAERMHACRLAISAEIKEELKRTSYEGKADPMAAYASLYPSFPLVDGAESQGLMRDLAELMFRDRPLNDRDKSDLRHLATAITHDLAGFVTSDEAILAASSTIKERYGLRVASPAAFRMDSFSPSTRASFDISGASLQLDAVAADDERVRSLLSNAGLSGSAIATAWCPVDAHAQVAARVAVSQGDVVLGYLVCLNRLASDQTIVARAVVGESAAGARAAGRILLMHLLDRLAPSGPRRIALELPPQQSLLREVAHGFGFRGAPGQAHLTKLIGGRVFTRENWDDYRSELVANGGPKLPQSIPVFRSADQQIPLLTSGGDRAHVSLDVLETLLSPALLCLPGRPAVITPIQRRFSEALLGHPKQAPLLAHGSASTYRDRHYLATPRSLDYFKRGALMFFYESGKQGGREELIALARVRQAYLRPEDALAPDLAQSVFTEAKLSEIGKSEVKTVVEFDNIFHLPRGVSLSCLQRIGCGRPNDLITTHAITDTQVQEILREAFGHGS